MDHGIVDRRRLLQWIALGSLSLPAVTLAGCASAGGSARPPNFRTGGGNRGGERGNGGGGSGGMGGAGSR